MSLRDAGKHLPATSSTGRMREVLVRDRPGQSYALARGPAEPVAPVPSRHEDVAKADEQVHGELGLDELAVHCRVAHHVAVAGQEQVITGPPKQRRL